MKLMGRIACALAGGALLTTVLTTPASADSIAAGGPVGALVQPVLDMLNLVNDTTTLGALLPSGIIAVR
ncbi:hypothetical protein ACFFV7_21045 [Nonomuraea spiralis]|uniref:Secreted protein n=1 Tax=Nonomuraea spiralis TaxID=46182 RepID=A0ABV5IIF4_9ACTN|nr:hypothetical protein [Nonomuraea spiralis]GGS98384.1 hypothetical protein GCM10010176_047910 [Nonomuraea spiralis]